MARFSLIDAPIDKFDDDCLGIGSYVEAMHEFVENCETPLTIGIQGDWGIVRDIEKLAAEGRGSDAEQAREKANRARYVRLGLGQRRLRRPVRTGGSSTGRVQADSGSDRDRVGGKRGRGERARRLGPSSS